MSSWNFLLSWVEHEMFYNLGARLLLMLLQYILALKTGKFKYKTNIVFRENSRLLHHLSCTQALFFFFTYFTLLWPWKLGQGHPNLIKSSSCPNVIKSSSCPNVISIQIRNQSANHLYLVLKKGSCQCCGLQKRDQHQNNMPPSSFVGEHNWYM